MERITIYNLNDDVYKKLCEIANKENRSISAQIVFFVSQGVKNYE